MDIVTIGNLSIDSIKTPQIYVESVPGGAAGAAACAAAVNGSKVGIVSKVGTDFNEHLNYLSDHKIDLDGIKVVKGKTTRFDLTYDKNFDLIDIKEIWGKSTDLSPSDIPKEYLKTKCFHICPNSPVLHSQFLNLKKSDAFVSLDPHMLYKHEIAKKMLSKFHMVTPNENEAIAMTKEKNPWKAAKLLSKYGPKIVIVTRGNKGSIIFDKSENEFTEVPAVRTSVVDTTGCGDTWNGAFLSEFLRHKDIKKSAWFASILSSFTAEKTGAYVPKIDENEIEKRIEQIKGLLNAKKKNTSSIVVRYSKKDKKFVTN